MVITTFTSPIVDGAFFRTFEGHHFDSQSRSHPSTGSSYDDGNMKPDGSRDGSSYVEGFDYSSGAAVESAFSWRDDWLDTGTPVCDWWDHGETGDYYYRV